MTFKMLFKIKKSIFGIYLSWAGFQHTIASRCVGASQRNWYSNQSDL